MEAIIEKYKKSGVKLTPQRLAIIKFLEGNTSHPTADDIFKSIKKDYPTISFATVYNTLEMLKTNNGLVEVTINPERKHYDPNVETHHHAICKSCGLIVDIFTDFSKALGVVEDEVSGFVFSGNHINFYGRCGDCTSERDS
ncbi:MAG: transcriptional repressor [Deltaproteobacteria bacterium]|nr:transcriptional repressor [Deltaproteobacteria bacterium]